MNEQEWQQQVVDLAHLLGWQHLHVRRTVGRGKRWTTATNLAGWPDIWAWHARLGFVGLELKVKPNKATPDQLAVLKSLTLAGARCLVAYPEDVDDVVALLRGERAEEAA